FRRVSSDLAKNENPLQGSFIIEQLTELVEEAVYAEFERLSDRGGVLGAMETMYQRGKIQEESHYYEELKHKGLYPIIGVNTFLSKEGSPTRIPREVTRATETGKQLQIRSVTAFRERNAAEAPGKLEALKSTALRNGNTFDQLMEACKVCSLGQLSEALYEVGGQDRRNMFRLHPSAHLVVFALLLVVVVNASPAATLLLLKINLPETITEVQADRTEFETKHTVLRKIQTRQVPVE